MTSNDEWVRERAREVARSARKTDGDSRWWLDSIILAFGKEAFERGKAEQEATLGVGEGRGQLFVHGTYESIKACQALIFRLEAAEAKLARLENPDEALVEAARYDWYHNHGPESRTLHGENVVGICRALARALTEGEE